MLILGANSDVAKACVIRYMRQGFFVVMASRDVDSMQSFICQQQLDASRIMCLAFDATEFDTHADFYQSLPRKPNIVLYAAGFLVQNEEAFGNFEKFQQMAETNYLGAVSILNRVAFDKDNPQLERIIGLSSLSGVRGRKSNFIYGSTKAAFYHYLEGLRQQLSDRKVVVNAFTLGYINTKINAGLELNKSLLMEPEYVANQIVKAGKRFNYIPDIRWKLIYLILKILPERLVKKLP